MQDLARLRIPTLQDASCMASAGLDTVAKELARAFESEGPMQIENLY